MKKYISKISLLAILLLQFNSSKAQLFKNLDKGIDKPILSTCFDSKGNLTVFYQYTNDSIKVDQFNFYSQKWTNYSKFFNNGYFGFKSIFKNDSLFFTAGLNTISGLFLVKNQNVFKKGEFKSKISFFTPIINELKIINNNLVVLGYFDSIKNEAGNTMATNKVVLYNGNWQNAQFPDNSQFFYTFNSANIGDTSLVGYGFDLYRYTFPNNWLKIRTTQYEVISVEKINGNELIYTISNYDNSNLFFDTIYSFKYNTLGVKNIIKYEYNNNRSWNQLIVHKNKIYTKSLNNNTFNLLRNDSIKPIYLNTDSTMNYMSNDTHLIVNENVNLLYNNKDYSKIAEINTDSFKVHGFDTIYGFIYWDKNNNGIKDNADVNVDGYGKNVNISLQYYTNSGKFIHILPDYNDWEYNLEGIFQYDTCLIKAFSGNLKTSNTRKNVTRDSIYFRLKRTSLIKNTNLVLKSISRRTSRLDDSTGIIFSVVNNNCDYTEKDANVRIYIDSDFVITNTEPSYTSRNGNILDFTITNISQNIKYIFVRGYYPSSKYSLGQNIKHFAKLTTNFVEDTIDNVDTTRQLLTYSYDPNAKYSYPEGIITKNIEKIRYTIHFQNEGNDDARRVTIVDSINLKMPVYSFQMIGATHPYSVSIQPGTNIVTWVFDNINLKPKSENEEKSKGYLVFEANVRGDLRVGDSIRNKAYIYFDYNEPIITNYAVITREEDRSNIENLLKNKNASLFIYPNPTSKELNIKNLKKEIVGFEVFNAIGQSIHKNELNLEENYTLNCENLAKGIYFIITSSGEQLKFIIQ